MIGDKRRFPIMPGANGEQVQKWATEAGLSRI
jgi:hypothetical protein